MCHDEGFPGGVRLGSGACLVVSGLLAATDWKSGLSALELALAEQYADKRYSIQTACKYPKSMQMSNLR